MKFKLLLFAAGLVCGIGAMSLVALNNEQDQVFHDLPKPFYKVLYDNEDVRIVEHVMNPEDEESLHTHPKMYVYFLEDCTALVTDVDGNTNERSFKRGDNFVVEGQSHSIVNIGSTNLHSLIIELNE